MADQKDASTVRWDSEEERRRLEAVVEALASESSSRGPSPAEAAGDPAGQEQPRALPPPRPAPPLVVGPPPPRAAPPAVPVGPASAPRSSSATETGGDYEAEEISAEAESRLAAEDKVGVLGGKLAGKSYYLQAIIERTAAGQRAGALTCFLEDDATHLHSALNRGDVARPRILSDFLRNYREWRRLDTTLGTNQMWYLLSLTFRAGWVGGERSTMSLEFFDGSGEEFFEVMNDERTRPLWRDAYLDAKVMVFCLPIWAAFPARGLSDQDWVLRDRLLNGFDKVVENFHEVRRRFGRTQPVQSILALTMADDRRSALRTLRDRWITPYLDNADRYLKRFRSERGLAEYLATARRVSELLQEEFASVADNQVARIPASLDFHGGRPWLIPVSAIEGAVLEVVEEAAEAGRSPRRPPPVPVHVELPLLVALCERHNALM